MTLGSWLLAGWSWRGNSSGEVWGEFKKADIKWLRQEGRCDVRRHQWGQNPINSWFSGGGVTWPTSDSLSNPIFGSHDGLSRWGWRSPYRSWGPGWNRACQGCGRHTSYTRWRGSPTERESQGVGARSEKCAATCESWTVNVAEWKTQTKRYKKYFY